LERALGILDEGQKDEEPLGICPDSHKPVFLKKGRFGPYVQLGTPDDGEKPRNASLLRGMEPESVDLGIALKLLGLPRDIGLHPESNQPVVAYNGRFGPYVKCDEETRSLPAEISPLDVTLEQALELLAQPKTRGVRRAKKEPLKVFEASPVTQEPIKLLDGRYGPYVTDGQTNASLPKTMPAEELTFDGAVRLLAERAARQPTPKKRQTTAKKRTNASAPAEKESPQKKTTTRRAPAKKRAATKKTSAKKSSAKKSSAKKSRTSKRSSDK
jgi:DNA topoisomerase-1